MNKAVKLKNPKDYKAQWIFGGTLAVTIYFDTQVQDPFNSPKIWVLMLVAGVLASYVATEKTHLSTESKRIFAITKIIIILFALTILLMASLSYDKQTALLGESFRKNGFITYLAFSILFIAAVKFIRYENIFIGLRYMLYGGLITGGYALIQSFNLDWVDWSVQNQVISTFGNTNFSGVGMALFAIAALGNLIINLGNYRLASINFATLVILIYAVSKTNARQAIIILILGILVCLSIYIYRLNKNIWWFFVSMFILALTFVALAIFKIGPLADLIYKQSLAVRQYYWLAGWEMFKKNPWTGVGIDHYGLYFKEYREVGYPLTFGWDITSSNAHNVPIQMFATGGVFVGLLYLAIQLLVIYRAVKLITSSIGVKQSVSVLIFAIWLAYQVQSLFSIEMLGISMWGWVLGGSIIGMSLQDEVLEIKKSQSSVELNLNRIVLSTILTLCVLIMIVPLRQAEKTTFRLQFDLGSDKTQQIKNFNESFDSLFQNKFAQIDYKNLAIFRLLTLGEIVKGKTELEKLIVDNYRNLDTLALLVEVYEKTGDYKAAITYRQQIAKYDPWNAKNYLGLAQLYKQVGRYSEMTSMVEKISSFAPNDPIAKVAQKEFPAIVN